MYTYPHTYIHTHYSPVALYTHLCRFKISFESRWNLIGKARRFSLPPAGKFEVTTICSDFGVVILEPHKYHGCVAAAVTSVTRNRSHHIDHTNARWIIACLPDVLDIAPKEPRQLPLDVRHHHSSHMAAKCAQSLPDLCIRGNRQGPDSSILKVRSG